MTDFLQKHAQQMPHDDWDQVMALARHRSQKVGSCRFQKPAWTLREKAALVPAVNSVSGFEKHERDERWGPFPGGNDAVVPCRKPPAETEWIDW